MKRIHFVKTRIVTDFIFVTLSGVEALIANLYGFSMRSFDFTQGEKKTFVKSCTL